MWRHVVAPVAAFVFIIRQPKDARQDWNPQQRCWWDFVISHCALPVSGSVAETTGVSYVMTQTLYDDVLSVSFEVAACGNVF